MGEIVDDEDLKKVPEALTVNKVGVNLNPWVVVVFSKGLNGEEHPEAIPESWIIENGRKAMWPAFNFMASKAIKFKKTPEPNWIPYNLKSVYWDTDKTSDSMNSGSDLSSVTYNKIETLNEDENRSETHESTNSRQTKTDDMNSMNTTQNSNITSENNNSQKKQNEGLKPRVISVQVLKQGITPMKTIGSKKADSHVKGAPGKTSNKLAMDQVPTCSKTLGFNCADINADSSEIVHNNMPINSANTQRNINALIADSNKTESAALRLDNKNIFTPEGFFDLSDSEKLNVIGLAQQQIIANQCKMNVINNTPQKNEIEGLSIEETLALKNVFPLEGIEQFKYFNEKLRGSKDYRQKIWQYIQPFIDNDDWRKTVRTVLSNIMCDVIQEMYSCCGRKGKKALNETEFYDFIEIAATKMGNKENRPTIRNVQTYVSNWLKQAKNRLGGYEKENDGSKPVRKEKKNVKKQTLNVVNAMGTLPSSDFEQHNSPTGSESSDST